MVNKNYDKKLRFLQETQFFLLKWGIMIKFA